MTTAIVIENLSKRYQRLTDSADYVTLRERIMGLALAPFRWLRKSRTRFPVRLLGPQGCLV